MAQENISDSSEFPSEWLDSLESYFQGLSTEQIGKIRMQIVGEAERETSKELSSFVRETKEKDRTLIIISLLAFAMYLLKGTKAGSAITRIFVNIIDAECYHAILSLKKEHGEAITFPEITRKLFPDARV